MNAQQLMSKWNEYITNGFSGENTEYYNNLLVEIEKEMPFESKEEHQEWLNIGATWNGEPEWLKMTENIIERLNWNKVFCLDMKSGKMFTKYFQDVEEQKKFIHKCKYSKKIMVCGYSCQNQEENEYLNW